MIKRIVYFVCFLAIISCTELNDKNNNKAIDEKITEEEVLIDTVNFKYTDWYPGKKQLRQEGSYDVNYLRHGKWVYYSKEGKELSMTTYTHGLKQGFSIVRHENGYYRGEYDKDTMVGLWTYFDNNGKKIKEINHDIK